MGNALSRLRAEGVAVWAETTLTAEGPEAGIRAAVTEGRVTGLRITAPLDAAPDAVRHACDLLSRADRTPSGAVGPVVLPVLPPPGPDPDARSLVAAARALVRAVDRPNLRVGLPGVPAVAEAVTDLIAEGVSVQVGPVYSGERLGELVRAHLAGLERAVDAGLDLSSIDLGVEFAVGPVDGAVDVLLDKAGTEEAKAFQGRAGLAAARLAYHEFAEAWAPGASPRLAALVAAGARPGLLVWTSAYDLVPGRRGTRYVEELVAPGTAVVLPAGVLDAVAQDALIGGARAHREREGSRRVLDYLSWFGVRHPEVVAELERAPVDRPAVAA
ncbi:transaldolase family protein [Streptomyces sp. BI20]|uniref:transaldolase family protein n=1 Tax=Streptomyces sp. BI20 TaxID=3403460 RepID=UPI003C712440